MQRSCICIYCKSIWKRYSVSCSSMANIPILSDSEVEIDDETPLMDEEHCHAVSHNCAVECGNPENQLGCKWIEREMFLNVFPQVNAMQSESRKRQPDKDQRVIKAAKRSIKPKRASLLDLVAWVWTRILSLQTWSILLEGFLEDPWEDINPEQMMQVSNFVELFRQMLMNTNTNLKETDLIPLPKKTFYLPDTLSKERSFTATYTYDEMSKIFGHWRKYVASRVPELLSKGSSTASASTSISNIQDQSEEDPFEFMINNRVLAGSVPCCIRRETSEAVSTAKWDAKSGAGYFTVNIGTFKAAKCLPHKETWKAFHSKYTFVTPSENHPLHRLLVDQVEKEIAKLSRENMMEMDSKMKKGFSRNF